MHVFISVDMEGLSGVVDWTHVNANHHEHARFRKIMTAEVNAAINGAFLGGATRISVADAHGRKTNILVEDLDPRAELQGGSPSPFAMMEGIQNKPDAVILIGYHARAGTAQGSLAHTFSGQVSDIGINNLSMGEIGLNSALAGHFNIPVLLVSSDFAGCAEAQTLLPGISTVVTKKAEGMFAARCLHPEIVLKKIQTECQNVVHDLLQGNAPDPLLVRSPVQAEIEFSHPGLAEKAASLPGTVLLNGRRLQINCQDFPTAYLGLRSMIKLANS